LKSALLNLPQNRHGERPGASDALDYHWGVELGNRVRKGFVPTILGTTFLTGLFFLGYFYVQRHPAYTPTIMPLTRLDLLIPFQPQALLAYVSLWLYIGAGPGLQRTYADAAIYGLWMCALCICGLVIFYFWPTQVPPLPLGATDFPGFAMLYQVDEASNACPSMHVAVAIFTAVRIDEVLRSTRSPLLLRLFNATWFLLVAYSTLAIKQHIVSDVAAGACLGLIFVFPSLRWRPKTNQEADLTNIGL
jgi:membrane-associated phospholipid phosphatase